jgi:hypothetical protein
LGWYQKKLYLYYLFTQLKAYAYDTYLDLSKKIENWDKFKKFKYVPLVGWNTHPQLVGDWGKEDLKHNCCNPSLGFATKAKGLARLGPRGSLKVTLHAPRSVGKCEEMNPHTPKATPTLGYGVLVDSWIFRRQLQRSKLNALKSSLYHLKALGT